MPVSTRTPVIGVTPVLVIISNQARRGWRVTFPSAGVFAGNSGIVFLGKNFPPPNTNPPNQPVDVLTPGSELKENKRFDGDTIFLGDIWLTASAAGQQVIVEEDLGV